MANETLYAALFVGASTWLVFTPLILYFIFRFAPLLRITHLQKKLPRTVIVFCSLILLVVAVERPVTFVFRTKLIPIPKVVHSISWGLYYAGAYTYLVRCWYLLSQVSIALSVSGTKWKRLINSAKCDDWISLHAHVLGNFWCICMICGCATLMSMCLCLASSLCFSEWARMTNGILLSIPFLLSLVVWWKIPVYQDFFGLRDEMRVTIQLMLLLLGIFVANTLNLRMGWTTNSMSRAWTNVFGITPAQIVLVLLAYNSTARSFNLEQERDEKEVPQLSVNPFVNETPRTSLKHTLSDGELLDMFVQHLQREFALENILFFIECTQFRQQFSIPPPPDGLYCPLSTDIPKSSIVFGETNAPLKKPQEIMEKIYLRYIDYSSKIQINLPSRLFQKFEDLFGDARPAWSLTKAVSLSFGSVGKAPELELVEINELKIVRTDSSGDVVDPSDDPNGLFKAVDDAVIEIYKLLFDSFRRFKVMCEG